MTAHAPDIDRQAKALLPIVREMLLEEVRRQAAVRRKAEADAVEAEILKASIAVARASDRLVEARYSGAPEAQAHRTLIKTTAHLSEIMRKHGRMPRLAR